MRVVSGARHGAVGWRERQRGCGSPGLGADVVEEGGNGEVGVWPTTPQPWIMAVPCVRLQPVDAVLWAMPSPFRAEPRLVWAGISGAYCRINFRR